MLHHTTAFCGAIHVDAAPRATCSWCNPAAPLQQHSRASAAGPATAGHHARRSACRPESMPCALSLPACSAHSGRRQRRRLGCAAAASTSGAPSNEQQEASETIRENVDRAAKTLEEMVEEVAHEMFAAEAAAYLSSDPPELAVADAVRSAVSSRLEWLDANFLAALNVYVQSARAGGDGALLELLVALREEVLLQVSRRLPPAVRVLDQVLQHRDAQQRLQLLHRALAGGQGELPGADMDALSATCGQFIDDMEDQQVVADRALLARLCLVREDLRRLHAAAGGNPNNVLAFHRSNLPRRCAAFLKELLVVGAPQKRLALMEKAFREDWEGAAPSPAPAASTSGQANAEGAPASDDATQQEEPVNDFVRPGRFLATLHAMRSEMVGDDGAAAAGAGAGAAAAGTSEQEAAGGGGGGAGGGAPSLVQRMEQVRQEALVVLQKIQSGGGGQGGASVKAS